MNEEYRKRVADAIFNQYRNYFKDGMGDGFAEKIAGYAARAAIEAMREPTAEMLSAAVVSWHTLPGTLRDKLGNAVRAALAEALR